MNFRIHHAKEHRKRLRFLCLAVSLASTAQLSINCARLAAAPRPALYHVAATLTREVRDVRAVVQDSMPSGFIRVAAVLMLLTVFGLTFREQFYTRVMSQGFGQHVVASALALLLVTGRILSRDEDSTFTGPGHEVPTVGEDDTGFFFLTLGGLSVLAAIQYTAALTAGTLTTVWYIVAAVIWGSSDNIGKITTVVTAFFGAAAPPASPRAPPPIGQPPCERWLTRRSHFPRAQRSLCLRLWPVTLSCRSAATLCSRPASSWSRWT